MTRDVSLAFLLPILVFVAFLGVSGWLLKDVVAQPYQTVLAVALSLPATIVSMLTVRLLLRSDRKKQCPE